MFKHLHIVACSPRSGTTLLHEAMVTCFSVDKYYDHEMRFNKAWAESGQILVTKRPKDTAYIEELLVRDADFYVIYVVRDPRDVIVSRHGKDKDIYYSNIRLYRELHEAARPVFGHDRFLKVRYEDFVSDPDATQVKIAGRYPWLEQKYRFSEYHEHASVSEKSKLAMHSVRPIAPTSVGLWRSNLPRIKAQQHIHGSLTPELIELGYEESAAWEEELAGVTPDFTRSRYPEKVSWLRRVLSRVDSLRKIGAYTRRRRRNA